MGGWSEDGSKASWVKSREPLSEREGSGSQSPHSSEEAGNDRGAKEGRKVKDEKVKVRLQTWPPVPERATRCQDSGEAPEENVRLSPGSRRAWTDRMLEALVRGNEGKKWHTLSDKVWSPRTLSAAVNKREGRARGRDHQRYPIEYFTRAGLASLLSVTHPDLPAPRRT